MIRTFRNRDTEEVFEGRFVKWLPPDIRRKAQRKLLQIHAAARLADLEVPPSNRLETLRGDREGQWSIRVNRQWRICFVWMNADAYDVEIVDYH